MRTYTTGVYALALAVSVTATSSSPVPATGITSSKRSGITWGKCDRTEFDTAGNQNLVCGTLKVPLDYTSNSSETLRLKLVRRPAAKQPARGTIQFNFGGPGVPSREQFAWVADELLAMTGGEFDLVVFDPRGTGSTLPFTCYGTTKEDPQRYIQAMLSREIANASDTSPGRLWSMGRIIADDCRKRMGEKGELIGTPFVARDIMSVAEALDDGLVRYWGFSYGSALGVVLAALFPDRIESMVLDAVVNTHEYFNGWDAEWYDDTDAVVTGIFEACFQAEGCPFVTEYSSAAAARDGFLDFLENDLRYNPIAAGPYLLDYSAVKPFLFNYFYAPLMWPVTWEDMYLLMTRNVTVLLKTDDSKPMSTASLIGDYADAVDYGFGIWDQSTGIRCADKSPNLRAKNLEEIAPALRVLYEKSRFAGEFPLTTLARCAQWGTPAKEHVNPLPLDGPPLKTKNPILLIGNTYDPVTPIVSAFNVSKGLEGSVVLRHNAYGHSSLAEPSICTMKAVLDYFNNGTMPEPGTVCEPDQPMLPVSRNRTNVVRRADYSEEDESLLLSAQKLGEILARPGRPGFASKLQPRW